MIASSPQPRESRVFQNLGLTYEIRIRITLGFLFVLILIANLNSLRFFNETAAVSDESLRLQTAQNLNLIAATLSSSPRERLQSSAVRDLALAAGFEQLLLVETDLLRDTASGSSALISLEQLNSIRRAYALPKSVAGGVRAALPLTITEPLEVAANRFERGAFFHFVTDSGQPLTLFAALDADTQGELARFAKLNTLFQIISLLAASTIALLLLKITFKPYRQIKSEAIAAEVATPDRGESVDFAVATFQRVIAELQVKEKKLQELYAEQKQRAASLERYNEYVLRSMPSGVISCDTAGKLTHFNAAAGTILALEPQVLTGLNYREVFVTYPMLGDLFSSTLQSAQANRITETQIENGVGERFWISLSSSVLRDSDGHLRGAMIMINNLTELKRLEAAMMLKEHMAALGEMSAGLAHQLRNSMGAIVGFAQLLGRQAAVEPNSAAVAENILKEARATGDMLDRFLRLSRPSELAIAEVNFDDVTAALERHFHQQMERHHLRLSISRRPHLPPVLADQVLLQNILINLIQNGIHASPDGEVVAVEIAGDLGQNEVIISVIDHGRGIMPDVLEHIFTPFYTSGKADGTGLGLALVQKWVLAHGGRIDCDSTVGAGTTFTVHLPLSPEWLGADARQNPLAESRV